MKIIPIALGLFVTVLVFASSSAQAKGADEATCRAAIQAKHACKGNRPHSPGMSACIQAALQRCQKGGPGAI